MSKSRYCPLSRKSSTKSVRIRNLSHRILRRKTKDYMRVIRVGKSEYDEIAEPSEILRRKILQDWYW